MRLQIEVSLDYWFEEPADVLLQLEIAQLAGQSLVSDRLTVSSEEPLRPVAGEGAIGQRTWTRATGAFLVNYLAEAEVLRRPVDLAGLTAADPRMLPAETIPYVLPSRYVEADRFDSFVESRFGDVEGGAKILAMLDWFDTEMTYAPGSSTSATTAITSFVERRGVCRDYAHLLIAFARAAGIPARMVSAYAPDVAPQDFHAVVELWLGGAWRLVDPTGMAAADELALIAAGRDATDIAFMTIFGNAEMRGQSVTTRRAADPVSVTLL